MNKICESLYHDNEDYKQHRTNDLNNSIINENSNYKEIMELKNEISSLTEDNEGLRK